MRPHREHKDHRLSLFLLLLCCETFVFGPLARTGGSAVAVTNGIVFSLLLLAGVMALAHHPVARLVSAVITLCAFALRWAANMTGSPEVYLWDIVFSLAATLCFLVLVLDQIYREAPVTEHKILGAVAAYLLIAAAFAFLYNIVDLLIPGSFTPFPGKGGIMPGQQDAFLYFSISTITTVGFGDITAVQPMARSLVMLESIIGILYPPVLIGILVTLHTDVIRDRNGNRA